MALLKIRFCGLAAGIAIAALLMPVGKAGATVIGYSSLQITNFILTAGAELIVIPSATAVNTTTSAASLDGVNDSNSSPVVGSPGGLVADSDVALSCVGVCGAIGQNDYSSVAAANPGSHFARSDASLTGSLLVPGGLDARTVAETQLTSLAAASGNAAIQSGNFWTLVFVPTGSGDLVLTLTFDVLGQLRAFSDEVDGIALVDFDFDIKLFDIEAGVTVDFGISSVNGETDFASLNETRSVLGVGEFDYLVDDTFTLTISGLLPNTSYRLQITQNADVSASSKAATVVPEPGTLTLLGLGLLGVGGLAARGKPGFGCRSFGAL